MAESRAAQLERERDATLVVGAQREEERFSRRGCPDRVGLRLGLDPAAAQRLLERQAVLPIEVEDDHAPGRREPDGHAGHDGGSGADRVQEHDEQHADRGVGPAIDERVDGGLDPTPLTGMDGGVTDFGRRLAQRLEHDALDPPQCDDRPCDGTECEQDREEHRRRRLQSDGGPEAEPAHDQARDAELEEQRQRVQPDVELAEEFRERVRIRVEMLDEHLELKVDQRRHDHR
jgi:hypothetical protein